VLTGRVEQHPSHLEKTVLTKVPFRATLKLQDFPPIYTREDIHVVFAQRRSLAESNPADQTPVKMPHHTGRQRMGRFAFPGLLI
jgi:hypothetical protein